MEVTMSDQTSNGSNTAAIIMAFLGGAAVGAGVVALTTPRSGPYVREKMTNYVQSSTEDVRQLPEAVREASQAARRAFNESLAQNIAGDGERAEAQA
jgi:gas vesicle protein